MRKQPAKRGAKPAAKPPTTIDEYLAGVAPKQRAALQRLRKQLHAMAPGSEECISYGIPGMRHGGRSYMAFGAWVDHLSLFPGGIVQQYAEELEGFELRKGTIHFQPGKPVPAAILRKMVKANLARNIRKAKAR